MLTELHDIDGADPASLWPLAVGWWIVIGAILLISGFLFYKLIKRRSWQAEVLKNLSCLEKNLSEFNARETVSILSEYLRRIALKRHSREMCAGLIGEEWLKWLKEKDLKGFDWETKGLALLNMPYAPQQTSISIENVKELIRAVKKWVK